MKENFPARELENPVRNLGNAIEDDMSGILQLEKEPLINSLEKLAEDLGYEVVDKDVSRPWGGFLRFSNKDTEKFIASFFPEVPMEDIKINPEAEASPKILIVSPGARLSWQVHDRRSEIWRFLTEGLYIKGGAEEDFNQRPSRAKINQIVNIERGECHRIVGLENDSYSLVAEIWKHTDHNNLSDEEDITRLQDDFNR